MFMALETMALLLPTVLSPQPVSYEDKGMHSPCMLLTFSNGAGA